MRQLDTEVSIEPRIRPAAGPLTRALCAVLATTWVLLLLAGPRGIVSTWATEGANSPASTAIQTPGAGNAERVLRAGTPLGAMDLLAVDALDTLDLEEEEEEDSNQHDSARWLLRTAPLEPVHRAPSGVLDVLPARAEHSDPEARAPPLG